MLNSEEEALSQAAFDGKLEFLCTRMQLLEFADDERCWLEGTGVIRTDERGRLSFRMVPKFDADEQPTFRPDVQLGEFYKDSDYVVLVAVDERGREWRSNKFVPRISNLSLAFGNWTMDEQLRDITHTSEWSTNSDGLCRIFIPRPRSLPFDKSTSTTVSVGNEKMNEKSSADHHIHVIGTKTVEFREIADGQWLLVSAEHEHEIEQSWPNLLCNALAFAVARPVRPNLIVTEAPGRKEVKLMSGPFLNLYSHLLLPLWNPHADYSIWEIVQLMAEWAAANASIAEALFSELHGIRNGATGSLSTASLTLTVGIEAIADLILADEADSAAIELLAKQKAELQKLIKEWNFDRKFKDRVLGANGKITNKPSPTSSVMAFAKARSLPEKFVSDWRLLRNDVAHGKSASDELKMYRLYCTATELFYRLLFDAIGFKGEMRRMSYDIWPLPAKNAKMEESGAVEAN